MTLRIKNLNCRVTVRTTAKTEPLLHQSAKAPRPELLFALPNAPVAMETAPDPAHTATGESDDALTKGKEAAARPRRADSRAVADRVYDLMREEVRLSRLRGGF